MRKVLFALTSNDKLGDTGRKAGFCVPEAAHPFCRSAQPPVPMTLM